MPARGTAYQANDTNRPALRCAASTVNVHGAAGQVFNSTTQTGVHDVDYQQVP
jgi:hypothetical protein